MVAVSKMQYEQMASEISGAAVSVWDNSLENCEDGIKLEDLWVILDKYIKPKDEYKMAPETKYELVDTEGLATCLAEDAWKEETKNVNTDDLYETTVGKEGMAKQVNAHWAHNFFALRDAFLKLIHDYKKK